MRRPLDGIKVVEFCKTIAGPFCGSLLGDMGADVVKIEIPGRGDDFRQASPILNGESYYFMFANRNKRSMTLNVKDPRGKEIFLDLVRDADVLIENYRPGTTKRLGLDYETIKRMNTRLVYCSISGYGQDGPYRDRAAYDLILQAMSGIMSVTGSKIDGPTYVGIPVVDVMTGLFAAYGILSCLVARQATGKGDYVDASLFDSAVGALMQLAGIYFIGGRSPMPRNKEDLMVPYGTFMAKDGAFVIEVGNVNTWHRFCESTGLTDLAYDPRFQEGHQRSENKELIIDRIRKVFLEKTVTEWLAIFNENGVPAGPINDIEHVFKDAQTLFRKMLVEVNHTKLGPVKLIGIPIKLGSTPLSIAIPPPLLGEHTKQVLGGLGYNDAEIQQLKDDEVI